MAYLNRLLIVGSNNSIEALSRATGWDRAPVVNGTGKVTRESNISLLTPLEKFMPAFSLESSAWLMKERFGITSDPKVYLNDAPKPGILDLLLKTKGGVPIPFVQRFAELNQNLTLSLVYITENNKRAGAFVAQGHSYSENKVKDVKKYAEQRGLIDPDGHIALGEVLQNLWAEAVAMGDIQFTSVIENKPSQRLVTNLSPNSGLGV